MGAGLPTVRILPFEVDVDIAVPAGDDLDAIFSITRHGVGDTRPNDFAVVVRLVRARNHSKAAVTNQGLRALHCDLGPNIGTAQWHPCASLELVCQHNPPTRP